MRKIIVILFVISILGYMGCGGLFGNSVIYKVTGSASRVDVTYENEDGGTSQESNVSVPWSYSFEANYDTFVYISAQNQGESGTVTLTIYINGGKWKTSTSSGAYCIATASGIL